MNALPRKRRKLGRPIAFTPTTQRKVIELVARGLPYRHACGGAGVSYSSFCEFRNAHPEFEERVQLAVSQAIEKRLRIIETAADLGDVGCAKWLLEHLHPEFFARNRIEVTGADGGPIAGAVITLAWPHQLPNQNGKPLTDDHTAAITSEPG